ncbi:MAG: signal peptidase II [Planctomycetes bacterium]|nr:signal peptidase II [Planctomycetota bacterium]
MSSDAPPPPTRPGVFTPRKLVALVIVVLGFASDLWTKGWMQERLGMDPDVVHQSDVIEVIPGCFRFQGNWNTGITFGLAAGHTEPILMFTAAACAVILGIVLLSRSPSRLLLVALAMILGGALGNLYDRWKWHKVRDFVVLYVGDWQWPAFNVADTLIVVGVVLILWRELFGHRAPAPAKGTGA